jgi:hypothetical protein
MTPENQSKEFAAAAEQKNVGIVGEFIAFLKDNKKWWLLPILLVLVLLGFFAYLGATSVGPFIYTIF